MDPYVVLGIPRGTSKEDAKKTYRALAHKYHPDKNPDDKTAEEKFKQINEAWSLIDSGKADAQPGWANHAGGSAWESLFGSGQFRTNSEPPIVVSLRLSFEQAMLGGDHEIKYATKKRCTACNSTGDASGVGVGCGQCSGTGKIKGKSTFFGVQYMSCPGCAGRGTTVKERCPPCSGTGSVRELITTGLKLDRAVTSGVLTWKISGTNEVLQIHIHVGDSELMMSGGDVFSTVELTFAEALAGCKKSVKTAHGDKAVTIAPLTNPGSNVRLAGLGARLSEHTYGNHIMKVKVAFPKNLTEDKIKKIIEVLDDTTVNEDGGSQTEGN